MAAAIALLSAALQLLPSDTASACVQPTTWSISAAFDLAANGLLPPNYPTLSDNGSVRSIPTSILKAVGWVESNWRQFDGAGRPLVSFDFGYGIMQITSGMAGAFGNLNGQIEPDSQSSIASDYVYNIAYGARILAQKWAAAPRIGDGDPAVIENWYYALWAYNGWGWANNPNNPRFRRQGTPAVYPATFPYQERVLYLAAHPPRDRDGNPLWRAVRVTLPPRSAIGSNAGPIVIAKVHRQPVPALSAVYQAPAIQTLAPGGTAAINVRVSNTGSQPWSATGSLTVSMGYHIFTSAGNPWAPFTPFSNGIVAYGQGIVPLSTDVAPGSSSSVRMTLTAPSKAGIYRIVWDLQQGAVTWFSLVNALPRVEKLVVAPPDTVATPPPPPTPTPTPAPAKNLQFVADTSIPDGTTLGASRAFEKGWLVFNTGHVPWKAGWALHLVSGPAFHARSIPVPTTLPCRSSNIVARLRAPARPGDYKSVWRIEDLKGHVFGQPLTVSVAVRGNVVGPTPVPTGVARPTQTPVSPTPTPVG